MNACQGNVVHAILMQQNKNAEEEITEVYKNKSQDLVVYRSTRTKQTAIIWIAIAWPVQWDRLKERHC